MKKESSRNLEGINITNVKFPYTTDRQHRSKQGSAQPILSNNAKIMLEGKRKVSLAKDTKTSGTQKKATKKEEIVSCKDCVNKIYVKANLSCGHTCCESCIMKFSIFCYSGYKSYEYSAYCATCNALRKISILSITGS